jgi:putative peptide zinc metalloprotease protein
MLALFPTILVHLMLHELSHIIACKKLGGRVKEVGLGLLYYFIPVAFVTYKDTYRLSKLSRAKMAIVGPMFDLSAMALVSIMLMIFPHLHYIFIPLLFLQLSFLMFNLNLLLPSDAYRFIESLSQNYNVRRRAFQYVFAVIMRRERQLHLRNLNTKSKVFYFTYTFLSVSYICLLFTLMMTMIRYIFGGGVLL